MSEESPQKGWDSWFSAQPNSPEDEPPEPAQEAAQPTPRPEPQEPPAAPATPPPPPTSSAPVPPPLERAPLAQAPVEPEPVEPPAAEPESEAEPEPESEAEQTNWTVPSLRAVLEGLGPDASEARVPDQAPSPDAERTRIAYRRPDAEATQFVPAPPPASPPPAPPAAAPTEAAPTQALPARAPASGRRAPSGYSRAAVPPPAAQPDEAEPAPSPASPASAAAPTSVVPPTPEAPAAGPAAPAWQVPQSALMWGDAAQSDVPQQPSRAQEPTRQVQQPPTSWPGNPANAVPQPRAAEDEWADWDDEAAQRRPEPAPSAAGAAGAGAHNGPPRPRSRRRFAVMGGGGAVVIVGLVLALVLNQGGSTKAAAKPSGFQPTGTSPAGDAQQTAAAFLASWQSGDLGQAAQYTDDPAAAQAALTSYKDGLNLAGLQLSVQGATADAAAPAGSSATGSTASAAASPAGPAGTVTFGVTAKVGLPASPSGSDSTSGASATASPDTGSSTGSTGSTGTADATGATAPSVTANWTYSSKLTAYEKNGGWWIEWSPALVAPNLTAGEKIVSVEVSPSASEVTDSAGNDLSGATDPGVHNIANALEKSAPAGQGTPGVEIELQGANGQPVANTTDELSKPVNTGVVKTTFTPSAEAAAQAAVASHADSSMVIIQPTTGDILAVANNDGDNDFALTARVAPGSTNKIITSTALLTSGLVSSPSQAVECPKDLTIDGDDFKNDSGESTPPSTPFLDDFAMSCNDAFAKWYSQIGDTTLAQTAQKYYGLNEQWNLGLGLAGPYYDIPSSASNGELAQELFGQGQLEASPLAMASVAATVDTGDFKQPIVVPGQAQASATPLPSNVQQDLQQLMKAVVNQSDGTAYNLFSGVNSTVYGKTGTADVGASQQKPNSWMVAFDPTLNVAIACVVLDAGYGASYAAPEEAQALEALQ